MLFDGDHAVTVTLSPERVAENLAPIGKVRLAEPLADTPNQATAPMSETPQPTEVIADAIENAVPSPAPDEDAVESAASAPPAEAVATRQRPAATETEIPSVAEIPPEAEMPSEPETPSEAERPSDAQAPPERAVSAAPPEAPVPDPMLELKPDRNGMHGVYRITPQGIFLYPHAIASPDIPRGSMSGITGSLGAAPAVDASAEASGGAGGQPP